MAVSSLETKAHELIGQIGPNKLAAVVHLLEVMIEHDEEDESDMLSPAEAKAIAEADEWSMHNAPIPHDQVLAEFGLSLADWERMSREP